MSKHLPLSKGEILQKRYQVIKQLGRGGMGVVYEAIDSRIGATVAVKETFPEDALSRSAFEHETKLLAQLHHEALPRVMDYFIEHEGQSSEAHYLVMEFIDGQDLDELLRDRGKSFEVGEVLDWADQILDALEYLHEHGIIHRDIKPQNLKCSSRGKIKLLDFGIAKGAVGDITTVQKYSLPAATLTYAPLEQVLRANIDSFQILDVNFHDKTVENFQKGTDARCDLYALGGTLYHLLTNRPPVKAYIRASSKWFGKGDNLPALKSINPLVSDDLAAAISKALEIEREDRFKSASEMRFALKKSNRQNFSRDDSFDEKYRLGRLTLQDYGNLKFPESYAVGCNLEAQEKEQRKLIIKFSEVVKKAETLGFDELLEELKTKSFLLEQETIDRLDKMIAVESKILKDIKNKEKEKKEKQARASRIRRANEIRQETGKKIYERKDKLRREQKELFEENESERKRRLFVTTVFALFLLVVMFGTTALVQTSKVSSSNQTNTYNMNSVKSSNSGNANRGKRLK